MIHYVLPHFLFFAIWKLLVKFNLKKLTLYTSHLAFVLTYVSIVFRLYAFEDEPYEFNENFRLLFDIGNFYIFTVFAYCYAPFVGTIIALLVTAVPTLYLIYKKYTENKYDIHTGDLLDEAGQSLKVQ